MYEVHKQEGGKQFRYNEIRYKHIQNVFSEVDKFRLYAQVLWYKKLPVGAT
jgi:hypothetical protein